MSYGSIEEAMLNGWGIERAFICHVHDDHNASASVNSTTGLWFCYSCHASGRIDLDRMEIDPRSALRTIEKLAAKVEAEQKVYTESWLDQFDALGPGDYWLSRFSEATCREFRLGHAPDGSYATIPYRTPSGVLLGVIRRDLTGKDPAKYRYPSGVDMTEYLFNYWMSEGRTLILTEGATDTIAAWEAGRRSVMATYGSNISRAQIKQIHRYNPAKVVVAFDQDDAGQRGWEKIQMLLSPYYVLERLWWDEYKDLASIPLEDRVRMLQTVAPKKIVVRSGHSDETRLG